jgi:hypothetical protein
MQDIHTDRQSGCFHPLTGTRGIGAFVWATLETPEVGAAIKWLSNRSRSSQPSIFPTGECQSRWVHAASIESKFKINNSVMERDNDTVE